MSYSESRSEEFFYFSEKEKELIENFLTGLGYEIGKNTVCGSCCGMYADEYWVGGIGGGWKVKSHANKFKKFAEDNGIGCSFSDYNPDGINYTISADPEKEDIKINSL